MKSNFKSGIFTSVLIFLIVANILYAQPQWPFTAYPSNPVLQKGPGWDSGVVFLPETIFLDSLFYLFYTGTIQFQVTPYAIGYATSSDGYHFNKSTSNPVLEGDGSGFDSSDVSMGALLTEGDSLILYYNGIAVGRAASVYPFDNWVRKDNPVIEKGSPGEWDSGFIDVQSVVKTDTGYMMYYSGGLTPPPGTARYEIGMATSTDGINWSKYDNPVTVNPPYAESDPVLQPGLAGSWDDDFAWQPSVLKIANHYEMFYLGGVPAGFGYAVSIDGIHWIKDILNNPIYVPHDDPYAFNTGGIVEAPTMVLKDSVYYMYYDYGFNVGEIGMSTAKRKPAILRIPADYPTIQAGINAALDGDTVLVAESTYYENLNFKGKAITVASLFIMDGDTNHINNTIIDGSQPGHPDSGSVVSFVSGEDTTSVLCGFTITGGSGTFTPPQPPSPGFRSGGGINCEYSGARICHNKIQYNTLAFATGVVSGGGIDAGPPGNTSWVILENNLISWNTITGQMGSGGGVSLTSNAKVYNNTIEHNTGTCSEPSVWGGGIGMGSGDPGITIPYDRFVIGNVIRFNKALTNGTGQGVGGGLAVFTSPKAVIKYNTITHNEVQGNAGVGARCYGAGVVLQNQNSETVFANNYVSDNKALANSICWGAGITLWSYAIPCSPLLNNNIIVNNTGAINGGGIYIGGLLLNKPRLFNNTITQNSAITGGGVYLNSSNSLIKNSIIWNNGTGIHSVGGVDTVEYSDVQEGWSGLGTGNIDDDPMFLDPSNHWFCLDEQSPCVDSGDINILDPEDPFNIGYALWPARGTIVSDMGAFGGPYACDWDPIITGLEKKTPDGELIPSTIQLFQNYPNPFNPSTAIEFTLPKSGYVTLRIYNILGEEVTTLVSEKLAAGKYKYDWDAHGLASGVYLYCLESGSFKQTKKLVLLK
ncbi:MAG: right-handed parallel beta-helix repeat-containing protein [Calditrichaeota bacterium]|nr:right-handed parallel beta-helix repeat-containing protein [Calditrichota bacterium]